VNSPIFLNNSTRNPSVVFILVSLDGEEYSLFDDIKIIKKVGN
jgi:hypothetical protein